jgi:hypothetical protein
MHRHAHTQHNTFVACWQGRCVNQGTGRYRWDPVGHLGILLRPLESLKVKAPCYFKTMETDYPMTKNHKKIESLFNIHSMMLGSSSGYPPSRDRIVNESQRMWEEAVIPWSDTLSQHLLQRTGTQQKTDMTASLQAKIWTLSHKHYAWWASTQPWYSRFC